MSIEVFDCEQGSTQWFACRLGIPTASEFDSVIAKGKGDAPSKVRQTYMLKLIGERMTGQPSERFENKHMERGRLLEPEAIAAYEMLTDVATTKVGFIRNGNAGCSPDRLIGETGALECKTKLPHLQLAAILEGELPDDHKAQCQGQLLIAEREWLDFISYWPNLPLFVKRVVRDEPYIKSLKEALDKFEEDLLNTMDKIQKAGA